MRDPVEEELDTNMARLAQGERDAFDPLFRALYPRAMRLMRVELPSDQAADAAQSALLRLFARAGEFEAGRPVLPWFYAILANELHAHRRRIGARRRREADVKLAADIVAPDDPERALAEREVSDALGRAIASLDDDSARAISVLLHGAERPPVTASAFRKRVSRAYARLRWLLGAFDGH